MIAEIRKRIGKMSWLALLGQFTKFGLVGVSNTIVSLAVYYTLVYINVHFIAANTIAFIISVLNSYLWNNKFVFKKNALTWQDHLKRIGKTYLAYGTTFLLGTGLLYLLVSILGVSEYIAPLINLVFTIPVNFVMNKFWAFK